MVVVGRVLRGGLHEGHPVALAVGLELAGVLDRGL
jgi:hypothetical protein